MSGQLPNNALKNLKQIFQYIRQKFTGIMFFSFARKAKSQRELSKLYGTPEEIRAKRFFQIMKDNDLNLLKRNPEEKVSLEILFDVFNDLREYYFSNTNPRGWSSFKDDLRKVILAENEIIGCRAALSLVNFGIEDGYRVLENFNITATTEERIKSAINLKETRLKLIKSKLNKNQTENEKRGVMDFYEMLGNLELQSKYQIDENLSLASWVGKLKALHKRQESERVVAEKAKMKNNNYAKRRA